MSPNAHCCSSNLISGSNRDGPRGIYVVEVGPDGPRGPPQSVLSSSDPHSISVSADGKRLAYAKFTPVTNIWSIPIPRSGPVSISDAVPVTTGHQVIESFSLSPDEKSIAFDSDQRGEFDIYKMRLDGGPQELVADISDLAFGPAWSPDGTEIAFYSGTGGTLQLLRVVSADGGTPEQLTHFPSQDMFPDWSPDGLTIAFNSQEGGPWSLWTVSRDSVGMHWSDPAQQTDFGCAEPAWAPDGTSLVCRARSSAGAWNQFLRVSRDGEVLSRLEMPTGLLDVSHHRFSPDGSRIYFQGTDEDGTWGLWWMLATGGDATNLVATDDPAPIASGFSVGSENVYFILTEWESDIWVMHLEW